MLASHDGNQQEIQDLVEEFGRAFARADADALGALLAEDYVHANAGGDVLYKRAWLNWIQTRREQLAAGRLKIESYVNADVEVRVFGKRADGDAPHFTTRTSHANSRDGVNRGRHDILASATGTD